ncbi:MAG: class I SAM-dependent methyltransferase [Bacteroidetes bacterium]|nr:class I SAM-dependent methyltransferase [Bacteroidota bacterium]
MLNELLTYKHLIEENAHLTPQAFVLKFKPSIGQVAIQLANQLFGRQQMGKKLPTWVGNSQVLFPPKINLEQTSSEQTAKHKFNPFSGELAVDLTAGFGVDSYYLSKRFKRVFACEKNAELSILAQHNAKQMGAENLSFLNEDGIEWLKTFNEPIDLIYLDPSRRTSKGKVVRLEDYEPNLLECHDLLFSKAEKVLVKASPLLDLKLAIDQLKQVAEIRVVSVRNECKELLFLLTKNAAKSPQIIAQNLESDEPDFTFNFEQETAVAPSFSEAQEYLYLPNSSILKAGAFNVVAQEFGLKKLHANTHLYTSNSQLGSFPGRIFKVVEAKFSKAKVVVRNYKNDEKTIRKKLKLAQGNGNEYLLAFTDIEKPKMAFAECLNQ